MKLHFHWHKYKYFPYEKVLAQREVAVLFKREPLVSTSGLVIETSANWAPDANQMTYFQEVTAANGDRVIPMQAVLEASLNGGTQPHLPTMGESRTLRRQVTRYSAHGLHEYRGKFNPQIVRAIGNILGLKAGDWVLDPFCGSGTTLVEAAHIGWNAMGVDINPLGVQIAQAKLAALRIPTAQLTAHCDLLKQRLTARIAGIEFDEALTDSQLQQIGGTDWEKRLPSLAYLRAWFTESVLAQLAAILSEIDKLALPESQLIFTMILSNILRDVSLQAPEDLRIRRRKSPPPNMPAILLFLAAIVSHTSPILKARQVLSAPGATQTALLGDIREGYALIKRRYPLAKFHAAITSPPYATALPYIDAQRLSLVVLGLIEADQIRQVEKCLIGNREITTGARQQTESLISNNADGLPDDCLSLCQKMLTALHDSEDGFRRRNMPALMYQYFRDMAAMFGQVYPLLQSQAKFVLVVGPNKTRLGGEEFVIDTPQLLASLAGQHGFVLREALDLDTYPRYDVHRANSICSEKLLIFEAQA